VGEIPQHVVLRVGEIPAAESGLGVGVCVLHPLKKATRGTNARWPTVGGWRTPSMQWNNL